MILSKATGETAEIEGGSTESPELVRQLTEVMEGETLDDVEKPAGLYTG